MCALCHCYCIRSAFTQGHTWYVNKNRSPTHIEHRAKSMYLLCARRWSCTSPARPSNFMRFSECNAKKNSVQCSRNDRSIQTVLYRLELIIQRNFENYHCRWSQKWWMAVFARRPWNMNKRQCSTAGFWYNKKMIHQRWGFLLSRRVFSRPLMCTVHLSPPRCPWWNSDNRQLLSLARLDQQILREWSKSAQTLIVVICIM